MLALCKYSTLVCKMRHEGVTWEKYHVYLGSQIPSHPSSSLISSVILSKLLNLSFLIFEVGE